MLRLEGGVNPSIARTRMSPLRNPEPSSPTIPAPAPEERQPPYSGQWLVEDSIETWPESEPPDAPTLAPPPVDEPAADSDDFRDTIPSPPPPVPSRS